MLRVEMPCATYFTRMCCNELIKSLQGAKRVCAGVCTVGVAGNTGAGTGTQASGAHQAFGEGCASPPASGISLSGNILIAVCGANVLSVMG